MSCQTASACRRRSRAVCDGDSSLGTPCVEDTDVVGDTAVTATQCCWEAGGGDVGGVKNSSSDEVT